MDTILVSQHSEQHTCRDESLSSINFGTGEEQST